MSLPDEKLKTISEQLKKGVAPPKETGIHSVGADRWGEEPFLTQPGQCVGSRSETSQCQRGATRARVVAAKIAGHAADPGHIVARASRGEHGCGETSAQCRRVEEDRRFRAGLGEILETACPQA